MLQDKFIAFLALKVLVFGNVLVVNGQTPPGTIPSGPLNQTVAPGETSYFNCHANCTSLQWFINNSEIFPRRIYEERGFVFIDMFITPPSDNQLHEENNTIIVEAHSLLNNTNISCRVRGLQPGQYMDTNATLIVAGPPLIPSYNLTQEHLAYDFILYIISWSAPFTWSEFPITKYSIEIQNYSNGDLTTVTKSNTSFMHFFVSDGSDCYRLDFSVFAYNRVGRSKALVTSSGHPLVPVKIKDIETNVTFHSDGTAQLSISFLVPMICSEYQTGTFSIAIYTDNKHRLLEKFGPENYTLNNEVQSTLVQKVVEANLSLDQLYQVVIVVESIGVSVSNWSTFSTYTQADMQESSTVASEAIGTGTRSIQPNTIAGIASGVTVFCLLIIIIVGIAVCFVCKSKDRKRSKTTDTADGGSSTEFRERRARIRPGSLKMESSNPIYEGSAVYETMPGESYKSLLSPTSTSTPSTPLVDSATRYTFDSSMVPSLPAPRKASVCQVPTLKLVEEGEHLDPLEGFELPPSKVGDDYMVMQKPSSDATGDRSKMT